MRNARIIVDTNVLISRLLIPQSTLRVCRDAKDDKFLELAVDGRALFIVIGEKDLLALSPFRSIRIVTPAQALAMPDADFAGGDNRV